MSTRPTSSPVEDLRAAVLRAAAQLGAEPRAVPTLERPKQAGHGDYATNAAMLLAGAMRAAPRDVAVRLAEQLRLELVGRVQDVEVAGPGFLNLTLSDAWYADALGDILAAGAAYGAGGADAPQRVNVEFVSVNPTGPLHVGHARGAAYGDALARMLAFAGHSVAREYYVNDHGTQIGLLTESIRARARGEEAPADGYVGAYIAEAAAAIPDAATLDDAALREASIAVMLDGIRATLERFGVSFDTFFSEESLYPDAVQHGFDVLSAQGRTYEHDGAFWLRTTEFGDDRDRVLRRSSGETTYFASDIAYHQDKRERGFERLVDVWGADHHGYMPRMQAAWQALGGQPQDLELLIMQLVSLTDGGAPVRMSKRAGDFVTFDDLLDLIGADAARWYLLQRSHDTQMELDVAQARQQSAENPVYYVQYAHARIASIRRRATATPDPSPPAGPLHPSERELIRALVAFPADLADATARRAPHRLTAATLALAQVFTAFYRDCPIVGDPAEPFRVALAGATQDVLARCLGLLGISAPEQM